MHDLTWPAAISTPAWSSAERVAASWVRMSQQYSPSWTMRLRPRIWPSMRASRRSMDLVDSASTPKSYPHGYLLSSRALEDERDVVPAEAERVRKRVLDVGVAGGIGDVVEVALGVGDLVVDRGRKLRVAHCQEADEGFDCARGSEG